MRTRCPTCATTFRVTSAQLRAKAGKVKCGQCHGLFNAFDNLLPEVSDPATTTALPVVEPQPPVVVESPPPVPQELPPEAPVVELAPPPKPDELVVDVEPFPTIAEDSPPAEEVEEPAQAPEPEETTELVAEEVAPEVAEDAPATDESVEETSQAAREAGLVAARELTETPAYNRWAANALTGASLGGFEPVQAKPARWPFVLAFILLLLALTGQLLYQFRTEAVLRQPALSTLFDALTIDVPLPGHIELVGIEASDLQSDNARGLLDLQATLKNRATYAQAWPALELTLTDAQDTVIARRALAAADYLPPNADPQRFVGNGEIGVRLWIDAHELKASGFRLNLFYP
jgi:predicted Zn finger-like uncharacterized protein